MEEGPVHCGYGVPGMYKKGNSAEEGKQACRQCSSVVPTLASLNDGLYPIC